MEINVKSVDTNSYRVREGAITRFILTDDVLYYNISSTLDLYGELPKTPIKQVEVGSISKSDIIGVHLTFDQDDMVYCVDIGSTFGASVRSVFNANDLKGAKEFINNINSWKWGTILPENLF